MIGCVAAARIGATLNRDQHRTSRGSRIRSATVAARTNDRTALDFGLLSHLMSLRRCAVGCAVAGNACVMP